MSGRIALMVRGLPSIPIEDAVERLGKYYPQTLERNTFHKSSTFTGTTFPKILGETYIPEVGFKNNVTGTDEPEGAFTLDKRKDLRKLGDDFEAFVEDRPSIYYAGPTSNSRAKLYRRIGFKDLLQGGQILDARRIAQDDLPYTQSLDPKLLGQLASQLPVNAGSNPANAFIKMEDGTIRSLDRFNPSVLTSAIKGSIPLESIDAKLRESNGMQIIQQRQQANQLKSQQNQYRLKQQEKDLYYKRLRLPEYRIPYQESQGLIPRITLN